MGTTSVGGTEPSDGEARFRALYQANAAAILSYAARRVQPPEDAADVVAETFLVAWRRLPDVPPGGEARPWLFGVARRVLANHGRGEGRRERLGERLRVAVADGLAGLDPAEHVVGPQVVRDELARMDPVDREVLELSAWEGLAPREIAAALGLPAAVVRTRLSRARSRLRDRLRDTGHDPSPPGHVPGIHSLLVPREDR